MTLPELIETLKGLKGGQQIEIKGLFNATVTFLSFDYINEEIELTHNGQCGVLSIFNITNIAILP